MSLLSQADTTIMSVDMSKPLNIAHRREREAERELEKQNFDEAELKYKLAADMMEETLKQASGSSLAAPLSVQLQKLRGMKVVIDIKRREAVQRKNADGGGGAFSQSQQNDFSSNVMPAYKTQAAGAVDEQCVKTSEISNLYKPAETEPASSPFTWQFVPKAELIRMVQYRETDSLLQFLNSPVEENDLTASRKVPKSNEEVIEQYKMRVTLLETTAKTLMMALDNKEKETELLQNQLSELHQENSELHEKLNIYERNQNYYGIRSGVQEFDEEQKLSNSMIASMLIDQPESYFQFNAKDIIKSELQDAVRDIVPSSTSIEAVTDNKCHYKVKSNSRASVQYEDLDVGSHTAVSEETLNADSRELGSTQMSMESLAGLPPLSPVHYDLDAIDPIVNYSRPHH